jgi:hypothetical protein
LRFVEFPGLAAMQHWTAAALDAIVRQNSEGAYKPLLMRLEIKGPFKGHEKTSA